MSFFMLCSCCGGPEESKGEISPVPVVALGRDAGAEAECPGSRDVKDEEKLVRQLTGQLEAHGISFDADDPAAVEQHAAQSGNKVVVVVDKSLTYGVEESISVSRMESKRTIGNDSVKSKASRTLTRVKSWFSGEGRPDFDGCWVCIDTWGLDDFLKACGIGRLQRLAASKAPWPSWEFQQRVDAFVFVNHGPLGDVRDEFMVGGPEYESLDGKKQKLKNKAFWDGRKLVIERSGPQGRFREERWITKDGKLHFSLKGIDASHDASWGRTFARKK